MANTLQRKTIAILATDGFEQVELHATEKSSRGSRRPHSGDLSERGRN